MRPLAFILTLIFAITAMAQRKDTDAKIPISNFARVKERKNVSDAENLHDKSTWIDEGQLKISHEMTDYSSYFIEVNEDSLLVWFATRSINEGWPPARWLQGSKPDYWIEYQYSHIIVKGNQLEEWAVMPRELSNQNLYYTEKFPLIDWTIGADTKEICGYNCIKATCHWRGRDYTAWFTPDIPVSSGPWKFGGLPGLIMKIHDNENVYSFEAVAVENGTFPIYAPRGSKYKQSTRENVWKLQRNLNENYLKTTNHSIFLIKSGKMIDSRKHPYAQLELE